MSERRQVWATLVDLLTRLERDVNTVHPASNGLATIEKEVRKLGKTQFKANMLAEEQATRTEAVLAEIEAQKAQQNELIERLVADQVATAQQEWLESLLPVLDGLDNAITSGKQYLAVRDRAASVPDLTPTQALLVSPADRAKLASWLDGLRLIRERLLSLLEAGGVTPIPTVGHPFDPYQHIAVATSPTGEGPPGTIVAEERRGYRTATRVLRYADVVVYRPDDR